MPSTNMFLRTPPTRGRVVMAYEPEEHYFSAPVGDEDSYASCDACGSLFLSERSVRPVPRGTIYYRTASECSTFGVPYTGEPVTIERVCVSCGEQLQLAYCYDHYLYYGRRSGCPTCVAENNRAADYRVAPWNLHRADKTDRFPRYIGIEFETGPWSLSAGGTDPSASEWLDASVITPGIEVKGDGSLETRSGGGGGFLHSHEIVTPPIRGADVSKYTDTIFNMATRWQFSIENILAGMHIHVDFRDVYYKIHKSYITKKDKTATQNMNMYLQAARLVCNRFISKRRRENKFCRSAVGVRGMIPMVLRPATDNILSMGITYPGIAYRIKTVEFRMWPSSNSKSNILARAELSSKIVERLGTMPTERWPIAAATMQTAAMMADDCDIEVVDYITSMLGLTRETSDTLRKIFMRYNKVSDGGMKFSDEIPNPDIVEKAIVAARGTSDARSVAFHAANVTLGDTTLFSPETGTYFVVDESPEPATILCTHACGYR